MRELPFPGTVCVEPPFAGERPFLKRASGMKVSVVMAAASVVGALRTAGVRISFIVEAALVEPTEFPVVRCIGTSGRVGETGAPLLIVRTPVPWRRIGAPLIFGTFAAEIFPGRTRIARPFEVAAF
uniref:hypothetical protein n=1 Tax=Pyramidobacter piscolens TaxID=638849 RepID=UPI003AF7DEB6